MFRLAFPLKGLSNRVFARSARLQPLGWDLTKLRRLPSPVLRTFSTTRRTDSLPWQGSHHTGSGVTGLDTIYALSSAPGRAGVAVIRISGPACLQIYGRLCPGKRPPPARYAAVRTLYNYDPESGDRLVLDSSALVLHFPAPKTVTGEDVLELHTHGGPATVKAVLCALAKCTSDGSIIRYAEPGEFTRRAFFNGRLDLAQVESLSDTLDAETEQQRRAAVRGSSGELGRGYDRMSEVLLEARGEIEALIDFAEDQHLDEDPADQLKTVVGRVQAILDSIKAHEAVGQRAELLRSGIRIALLGPPNAGKSSLMNLIVGREASIVSTEAGTTRDIVEASLDIRGYLCTFADTAGIRSQESWLDREGDPTEKPVSIGVVEQEGIRRARSKALDSDLIIVLASVERSSHGDGSYRIRYDEETLRLAAQAEQRIVVINKRDAAPTSELKSLTAEFRASVLAQMVTSGGLHSGAEPPLAIISCKEAAATAPGDSTILSRPSNARPTVPTPAPTPAPTTTPATASATSTATPAATVADPVGLKFTEDPGGIHALIDTLVSTFSAMTSLPPSMQDLYGVTERQRQLLARCRGHLEDFMAEVAGQNRSGQLDIVLAAEHLRYARNCLAAITGRGESGDVEDVLGVIFEKFCVGK